MITQWINRRLFSMLTLGFASGLPLALVGGTLQAWFAASNIDVVTIGLLALVGQPYVYKFVWSPFMDRFTLPFLGRRRGWIALTQTVLSILLLLMSFFTPQHTPGLLACIAFVAAFFSASQDIVIDAYRADTLAPKERGIGTAISIGGYRLAMITSGGIALILADHWGWQITYCLMSATMFCSMFFTLFAPEPTAQPTPPETLKSALIDPFKEFISRDNALLIITFIFLYKLGDSFTTSSGPLTTTFLLQGLGFSLSTVGYVNKGIALVATLMGVFIAGFAMVRLSLRQALFSFGCLQAVSNLMFVALAVSGKQLDMLICAVFIDNLCNGLGSTAITTYIISLCHPRFSATQFALLSSIAALSRVFLGPIGGFFVKHTDWLHFFWLSFIIAMIPVCMLWVIRPEPIPVLSPVDKSI